MWSNLDSDVADGGNQIKTQPVLKPVVIGKWGLFLAISILLIWATCLFFLLFSASDWPVWAQVVAILLQTHLYTGVFITMHDSIHGLVSTNKKLNYAVGFICAKLFAFNNFRRLSKKHHQHHEKVATENDPDFSDNQSFVRWYLKFILEYVDVWQILYMAMAFNFLKLWIPVLPLVLFWMIPAILSTFQLFYFGTYSPHKNPGLLEAPFRSRSQPLNHFRAFLSCYFFGYHKEHHIAPYLPWWKLPMAKEVMENQRIDH